MMKLLTIIISQFVLVLLITSINGNNTTAITTSTTTGTVTTINNNDSNSSISCIRVYNNQFNSQQKKNYNNNNIVLQQSLAINNAASIINNHRNLQNDACAPCETSSPQAKCLAGDKYIKGKWGKYSRKDVYCRVLCCHDKYDECCTKKPVPVPKQIPVHVAVPVPVPVPVPISTPREQPIPQIIQTQPVKQTTTTILPNTPELGISPVDASSHNPKPPINNVPTTLGNDFVPGTSTTDATTTTVTSASSPSYVSTGVVAGIVIGIIAVALVGFFVLRNDTKKNNTNSSQIQKTMISIPSSIHSNNNITNNNNIELTTKQQDYKPNYVFDTNLLVLESKNTTTRSKSSNDSISILTVAPDDDISSVDTTTAIASITNTQHQKQGITSTISRLISSRSSEIVGERCNTIVEGEFDDDDIEENSTLNNTTVKNNGNKKATAGNISVASSVSTSGYGNEF